MSATSDRAVFRLRAKWSAGLATFRTAWWRVLGMQIGRGTLLPRIHVTWPHQVSLGEDCRLEHEIYFKFDGIWATGPTIAIGDRVFIGFGCEFNVRKGVQIGADCLVASGCKFIDHDHGTSATDVPMNQQTSGVEAPILLEDDVWLGANVIVLKGVRIGRGAIVAAGAVVTKQISPFEIWGGIPARKIGLRTGTSAVQSTGGAT